MEPLGSANWGDPDATIEFESLSVGETLEIKFETDWDITNEFQPDFIVYIGFDPDLYLDGNPQNDEGEPSNNTLERSGYDINDMF